MTVRKVLITGAQGFLGRNLMLALDRDPLTSTFPVGRDELPDRLDACAEDVDFVVHLAGVNRSDDEAAFVEGNVELTAQLCRALSATGRSVPVIFSSSVHVGADSPYGETKRAAEEELSRYSVQTGSAVYLARLTNVFGKWARPNYNSVVATFCHAIQRRLPATINDPDAPLRLCYVDDVVDVVSSVIQAGTPASGIHELNIQPIYKTTVGELHTTLTRFRDTREAGVIPDFSDDLTKRLFTTYLSYAPDDELAYGVDLKQDDRGWLFEFLRSDAAGQIFVSTTRPGVTRGNHFHDSKVERFCVISGSGRISFRRMDNHTEHFVDVGSDSIQVVEIPPGTLHSITNTGASEMITLFWANEPFDVDRPDTWSTERSD